MIVKWAPALMGSIILSIAINTWIYACIIIKKRLVSSTCVAFSTICKIITFKTCNVAG